MQAEYPQDWLTTRLEETGQKQAAWRTDPAQSGGGAHRRHRQPRLQPRGLRQRPRGRGSCAPTSRPSSTAAGSTTTATSCCATRAARAACCGPRRSRPATTTRCALRVYGDQGGLAWHQETPDFLDLFPLGQPPQRIVRAQPGRGRQRRPRHPHPARPRRGLSRGLRQPLQRLRRADHRPARGPRARPRRAARARPSRTARAASSSSPPRSSPAPAARCGRISSLKL